jgi:hypothetical protein
LLLHHGGRGAAGTVEDIVTFTGRESDKRNRFGARTDYRPSRAQARQSLGSAVGRVVWAQQIDARVSGLKEAVLVGRETARLAPPRRRSLGHIELYAGAADQIDLTVRDVRALARAALAVVRPGSSVPERMSRAIRNLARATESMGVYMETSGAPDDTRAFALEAAREATVMLEEYEDLARNLRSTRSSTRSTRRRCIFSVARAWIEGRPARPMGGHGAYLRGLGCIRNR